METINPSDIRRAIFAESSGSYLWGALAGPSNAAKRQAVMAACGVKLPKSKCGYTLVFHTLCMVANATGCTSEMEKRVNEWLRS